MHQLAIACHGLKGVSEGMTIIEDRTQAGFFLVKFHDVCLDLTTTTYQKFKAALIFDNDFFSMLFKIFKKRQVNSHPILDDLGQSGPVFTVGKRRQGFHIDQHQKRLVKCTDKVLSPRVVYGGFAANTAIYLSQQSRRDLDKGNAAQIGCSS